MFIRVFRLESSTLGFRNCKPHSCSLQIFSKNQPWALRLYSDHIFFCRRYKTVYIQTLEHACVCTAWHFSLYIYSVSVHVPDVQKCAPSGQAGPLRAANPGKQKDLKSHAELLFSLDSQTSASSPVAIPAPPGDALMLSVFWFGFKTFGLFYGSSSSRWEPKKPRMTSLMLHLKFIYRCNSEHETRMNMWFLVVCNGSAISMWVKSVQKLHKQWNIFPSNQMNAGTVVFSVLSSPEEYFISTSVGSNISLVRYLCQDSWWKISWYTDWQTESIIIKQ